MVRWLSDLRNAALVALVAGVMSLPIPMWNATQRMTRLEAYILYKTWINLFIVLLYVLAATMPVFYYALFRNQVVLHFPKRIRPLALMAMICMLIFATHGLPQIPKIGAYWTTLKMLDWKKAATFLAVARDPNTVGSVSLLLQGFANLASIWLFSVLFRLATNKQMPDPQVSRQFRLTTKVAVVLSGLWFGFNVLRMIASPFVFLQIRNWALHAGRPAPSYWSFAREIVWALLSSAGLFAAPYIVYQSLKHPTVTVPAELPN